MVHHENMPNQAHTEQVERILAKPRTVAAMTDQSLSQVYRLIADGSYPSVRIGRSVRVPLDLLRKLLAERVEGGAEAHRPLGNRA